MTQSELWRADQARLAGKLARMRAAANRFVDWWGAHRPWPANECPRIGDGGRKLPTDR